MSRIVVPASTIVNHAVSAELRRAGNNRRL